MLEILGCNSQDEKFRWFESFDSKVDTWIVSDLQSKWQLQQHELRRIGYLRQSAISRATEVWRDLAFQVAPELHILPSELAETLFWEWIGEFRLPWVKSSRSVQVVLNQMQMWMAIFSDPQYPEIMAEWFRSHPDAFVRWGHWFELCSRLWKRCAEEKIALQAWLPAIILNRDRSKIQHQGVLTFDLGSQMTPVEALLIYELSRNHSVRVIAPEVPWLEIMRPTLGAYQILREKNGQSSQVSKERRAWQPTVGAGVKFVRFSTLLAEVKNAVAQARVWLEQGVSLTDIGILAPDIEAVWPVLKLYLAEEGIPCSKSSTAKLGGMKELAGWIASIRTRLKVVSSEDLEVHFFATTTSPKLSMSDFSVLFTHLYDEHDLNRAKELFEAESIVDDRQEMTIADFLAWGFSEWRGGTATDSLLSLLDVIGREVPRTMKLRPARWLEYLDGILARREITLDDGNLEGIWCASLSSADWLHVTHALVLNLNEGELRSLDLSHMNRREIDELYADTGFAIGTPDRQEREFELLWLLGRPWQELHLGFSGTDFHGEVLTPAKIWMWAGFVGDQLKLHPEMPLLNRWDELQSSALTEWGTVRGLGAERVNQVSWSLERDDKGENSSWIAPEQFYLSASSLEKYWKCPFVFAAERLFKLSDEAPLDLDLDHRGRGRLLHGLVELLLEEPITFQRSDDELLDFINSVRAREGIQVGDERLWPVVQQQHLKLAKQFLAFESDWRKKFPLTQTIAREQAFACYWDVQNGVPTAEKTSISLKGRLDRIDMDSQGRYAVIDYKASSAALGQWGSWLSKRTIQLGLYSLLVERGFCGVPSGPVVAANFYVVKKEDRKKGFYLQEDNPELYELGGRFRNVVSAIEKEKLFQGTMELVTAASEQLAQGEFNPKPSDKQQCRDCHWRAICRAPHLN